MEMNRIDREEIKIEQLMKMFPDKSMPFYIELTDFIQGLSETLFNIDGKKHKTGFVKNMPRFISGVLNLMKDFCTNPEQYDKRVEEKPE